VQKLPGSFNDMARVPDIVEAGRRYPPYRFGCAT
jgi:hypothetical protein